MTGGAAISSCGKYRYRLWRTWGDERLRVVFVMLNPSTADAECDDPTIRKCVHYARAWGYGHLEVVNLFSYRATSPTDLKVAVKTNERAAIGPETERYYNQAVPGASMVVCAWGNDGDLIDRGAAVFHWLLARRVRAYTLGKNKSGQPVHPLYQKNDLRPFVLGDVP